MIFTNCKVLTLNPSQPLAEAIAVKGNRIVFVGKAEDAKALKGCNTKIFDLQGSTVLPGLVDTHAHLTGLGRSLSQLNLIGTTSHENVREMVLKEIETDAENVWIKGRGWDQNDWKIREFPSFKDLAGTESHPVYLRRVDGHAAWVNKKTLEICGIDQNTIDPDGGKIIRDENGFPTGILLDKAIELIRTHVPKATKSEYQEWARKGIKECNRFGLVGMHDAGLDTSAIEALQALEESNELNLKIYGMLDGDDEVLVEKYISKGVNRDPRKRLRIEAIKLYVDGALGSRGAALLEPYSDDIGNTGLIVNQPDFMYNQAVKALENGFQICTHAIGDRGNRNTLDAYEKALKKVPVADHRFRIEHAQVVAPEDISRFANLGIIPSMQPIHATSDMYWAEDRVGIDRIKGAYAWRSLMEQGSFIPCGSDAPVESVNPFWGIFAAVTRMDHNGFPDNGWYPEQKMTLLEAVKGYTIHAAYAGFSEKETGTIEVGKLADLTIVKGDDFMEILDDVKNAGDPGLSKSSGHNEQQSKSYKWLLDIKVLYTIVDGEIVYSAE
ncbi:MAG: amidohydrolase family protein [Candidatus Electryonea clarkiae]|nr:amidohydrolase family protein [Candidatus Electryonea clarkiae]MDP8286517.1 amidohydrolase family protein [Candidatus Electryonea clarkiae]